MHGQPHIRFTSYFMSFKLLINTNSPKFLFSVALLLMSFSVHFITLFSLFIFSIYKSLSNVCPSGVRGTTDTDRSTNGVPFIWPTGVSSGLGTVFPTESETKGFEAVSPCSAAPPGAGYCHGRPSARHWVSHAYQLQASDCKNECSESIIILCVFMKSM